MVQIVAGPTQPKSMTGHLQLLSAEIGELAEQGYKTCIDDRPVRAFLAGVDADEPARQPDEPEAPDERTWKYKSQSLPSTLAFDAEKFTNETLRAAALSPDGDSHVKGLSLLFEAAPWFDIVNGINYPTAHLLNHGIADKFLKVVTLFLLLCFVFGLFDAPKIGSVLQC
ncbi:hypothetical protein CYMTET_16475 [Cymbomonas tetramitiformis]|uniref:Uncharacterized protein n=1 Tax=Cymbomonas tetramitiformis TaxID=36881 RepID=A0AAE0GC37_9CHLO|nr:hypothetical protein CYMTET_16475 [Cymbomonas tetramitiformis]